MQFYNPYHFIPVKKREDKSHDLSVEDFKNRKMAHHSHDRYQPDSYSGRIICTLKTDSRIFVGSVVNRESAENDVKEIAPFAIGNRLAIPATTLKGLISSLVEAASNSAMRVFDNEKTMSYRMKMENALSAIGMVVKNDEGSYHLRPLCMPLLEKEGDKNYKLPQGYRNAFQSVALKVFVDKSDYNSLKSYNRDLNNYCYMKLMPITSWNYEDGTLLYNDKLRFSHRDEKLKTVIGQIPLSPKVIGQEQYNKERDKGEYTRGILRIFRDNNRSDMPNTKKHEFFIPYPEEAESYPLLPIPEGVITRLRELADERAEEWLNRNDSSDSKSQYPYLPVGTRDYDIKDSERPIQDGDIVFFDLNNNGEVSEIAFSSIWRGQVTKAGRRTVGDFVPDSELLPFNESRTTISPAELMFGFTQVEKDKKGLHLFGKVRISQALLYGDNCLDISRHITEPVMLKILSSPKLPCPSMYFKKKTGDGHIAKQDLNPRNHEIQGRKIYLHSKTDQNDRPWETKHKGDNLKQKVKVSLIKNDRRFCFHVDFNNLSEYELGLLCYALKPSNDFRHKIGMGKPIGLGSVEINIAGIFLVDRKQRYTSSNILSSNRYHKIWTESNFMETLRGEYTREYEETTQIEPEKALNPEYIINKLSLDPDIKYAIELLGKPLSGTVHTPQIEGSDSETETFKWFVANDIGTGSKKNNTFIGPRKEFLKPIKNTLKTEEICLSRHKWIDN